METRSIEAIVRALEAASVRYLIVDGLAVNAHGYSRMTRDIDLVIQLEPANTQRASGSIGVGAPAKISFDLIVIKLGISAEYPINVF